MQVIHLTGATGFLGSRLAQRLEREGKKVVPIGRMADLKRIFREEPPTLVIHCATDYGRGDSRPEDVTEANVDFPTKVLDAAQAAGAKVFINTDTMLAEDVSHYASTKAGFRRLLQERTGLTVVNLALEHFYGPGESRTKFIGRMIEELLSGSERIDLTPGEQRRDFIYIDDVVEAFVLLAKRAPQLPVGFHSFQAGTGTTTSIKELMAHLVELTGAKTKLNFGAVPYRPNEAMDVRVDSSGLRRLGWMPKTELKDGLARAIEAAKGRVPA